MLAKLKQLGPGLLYAGAAIGVSHLVQSTKAGAQFGYWLIIAIVVAHIFKFPFFAIGPRYAHYSNQSLVQGFKEVGNWAVYLLLAITVLTMFTIQAAVTVVTAGLAQELTGLVLAPWVWSAILLIVCGAILLVGKLSILDHLMKVVMVVLAITTVVAFLFSFSADVEIVEANKTHFSFANPTHIAFLIAFLGWMPAPLDISVWQSIWTVRRNRKEKTSLNQVNFDFKVGFYGTAFLGICFLMLGANTIYGTGVELQASAAAFAGQLIQVFTTSLGSWSYYIILIAAFTTMFSTTLTCFDALPEVMKEIGKETGLKEKWNTKLSWALILGIVAIVILTFLVANMQQMVFVATVVSFLTAPILAGLSIFLFKQNLTNFVLWNKNELLLAWIGFIFLSVFSILFLIQLL